MINGTGTVNDQWIRLRVSPAELSAKVRKTTIFAQITSGCERYRHARDGGSSLIGPFKIELYKSAGSPDS